MVSEGSQSRFKNLLQNDFTLESGASANPCDEVYQGSTAFSEPESRAIRDFLWAHQNEIEAVITMHTYSQLWIHPFGHERGVYPPDVDDLVNFYFQFFKSVSKSTVLL